MYLFAVYINLPISTLDSCRATVQTNLLFLLVTLRRGLSLDSTDIWSPYLR